MKNDFIPNTNSDVIDILDNHIENLKSGDTSNNSQKIVPNNFKNDYIPTSINIMDISIAIENKQVSNCIGFADYYNRKILIDPQSSKIVEEEAFYHELTHWILYKMHNKLEADEKFVGIFGSLLNQAMKNVIKKAKSVGVPDDGEVDVSNNSKKETSIECGNVADETTANYGCVGKTEKIGY